MANEANETLPPNDGVMMALTERESGDVECSRADAEVLCEFVREGLVDRLAGTADIVEALPYASHGDPCALIVRLYVHECEDEMTLHLPLWLFTKGIAVAVTEATFMVLRLIEATRKGDGINAICAFGGMSGAVLEV